MSKTQFIADLGVGDEVAALFLISAAHQGQARNGPFWKLVLQDSTGTIEAKIWSPQCQAYPALACGDVVEVCGRISVYRDRHEVAVERMRVLADEEKEVLDLGLFMASADTPATDLLDELNAICRRTLIHKPWRKLISMVLNDPLVSGPLLAAPAAKVMHHAYAGGLLEHTLGVAKSCMAFADLYPDLDRQTLLAGAVCHDLGKLWELSQGLGTDYTGPGRLMGHIQLVLDFLEPRIRKAGLEEHLALHLKHLILSHHGQYDYGSPRLPSTAEAFALHYADNVDAKLNQVRGALATVEEGNWSSFVPGLDRMLFRAAPTPGGDALLRKSRKAEKQADAPGPDVSGQLSLLGERTIPQ